MSEQSMADQPPAEQPPRPKHALFRFPRIGIAAAAFAMFAASPFALSSPWLLTVYLIPLAVIYWIIRMRTVVDADGIVVRTLFGSQHLAWSRVKGLTIDPRSRVYAVRADDDSEVHLPTVLTRHLPIISAVSGGRIADPTASPEQTSEEDA